VARRDDILNAVYEADRLHREFNSKTRVEAGEGRVDVFGMLVKRDVPVMFRPLKKLLGAFFDDPAKGVMVTSQRPLRVQRFTAAHELGHEALGHKTSLDDEDILTRALFVTDTTYDPREIQANAFAAELLTPSWLIAHHMKRQELSYENLVDPVVVYQLSLRMGSSYSATCYALQGNKAIDRSTCERLLKVERKTIKQSLVAPYGPANWHGDVWLVTKRDDGMVLEGSRSDLVVLHFEEHASSGYLWEFGELADAGLAIKRDERAAISSKQHFGGVVFRTIVAEPQHEAGASGHVSLREARPWQAVGHPLQSLELEIDLSGPLPSGLLLEQRLALLSV
jgi:Zn-dependent peptidase ImmA (M78 family)